MRKHKRVFAHRGRLTTYLDTKRKITFITPHQLSTEAKRLIREGRQDFVKEIAGKGYYAGSSQLDQEVDLEIYIHIEEVNGRYYLCIQRGKHRKVTITPLEHLYAILPFQEVGGICDDVNGIDSSVSRLGAKRREDGTVENAFWDLNK